MCDNCELTYPLCTLKRLCSYQHIKYKEVNGVEFKKQDILSTGTTSVATHYMTGKQQPIEIMQDKMTKDQFIGFLIGNVIKYSLRINHKDNDREDAGKCSQYAKWLCDAMDGKIIVPGGK